MAVRVADPLPWLLVQSRTCRIGRRWPAVQRARAQRLPLSVCFPSLSLGNEGYPLVIDQFGGSTCKSTGVVKTNRTSPVTALGKGHQMDDHKMSECKAWDITKGCPHGQR